MKRWALFVSAILLCATCKSGGGGSGNVFTPVVSIECDKDVDPTCQYSSQTANCAGADKINGFGVITRNSCTNISTDYLARGQEELLCHSFGCNGSISSWKNSAGVDIDEMPGGTANVCVFVDITCDGLLNAGDLVFETSVSIHDNTADVEAVTWSTYP